MCCGCCGCSINLGGSFIASLKKGDEVTYTPDPTEPGKTLVILSVKGYSALCTDGTILTCHDGSFVEMTGKTQKAVPSLAAIKILILVFFRKIDHRFSDLIQKIRCDLSLLSWKLEKKFARK